ncbi:enterochelin esterase [Streptomyces sp. NBC_01525]|uniref:enterochelin esterase n=1 Tax=Streptomyces sp. NBC_01525 TaxID=2903893 RepID=UPI0038660A66
MLASTPPEGTAHHPPRVARPQPLPRIATGPVLPAPDRVAEFWAEVARTGTPLVGPDPEGDVDRVAVTFLWRGTPATRAVQVLPNKLVDPRAPEANLMTRLPGTDVWHWTLRLRRDWYGTYDFCVDEGDGPAPDDDGYWPWLRTRRHPDPLNSHALPGRWGGTEVSCARLPGAPRDAEWEPRPGVARSTVTTHDVPSTHLGGARRVRLYRPPQTAPDTELPVLVLLDGEHWQPGLGVADLLDNLIADGRIPPVAAVLPESVDVATRWRELTCRPEFVSFLDEELLPWAAGHLPLTADPARTVIAGQSLGGLTAAYAALTAPHRFGNVLAQSGSFWWPAGPDTEWLTGRLAATPRLPVRFRLSFGAQEWVTLPAARRFRDALAAAGYDDATYREFNGGHDYLCWRSELAGGIVELFADKREGGTAQVPPGS